LIFTVNLARLLIAGLAGLATHSNRRVMCIFTDGGSLKHCT
jgi:hypothetical protein